MSEPCGEPDEEDDHAPQRIFGGRYAVHGTCMFGSGNYASLHSAQDTSDGTLLSLKEYHEGGVEKLAREVEIFRKLGLVEGEGEPDDGESLQDAVSRKASAKKRGSFVVPENLAQSEEALASVNTRECFVRLLDFSHGGNFEPGMDADGACWSVVEQPEYTLEDHLLCRHERGEPLTTGELRDILRTWTTAVAWLHSADYAHLTIRPANLMFVDGKWKLGGLEGSQATQTPADITDLYSPLYASPEVAQAIGTCQKSFISSRAVDVWSLGICALDMVLTRPTLAEKYHELVEDGDETKWLEWFCDEAAPFELPSEINSCDPRLRSLLEKMLVKSPHGRISAPEILLHDLFEGAPLLGDSSERDQATLEFAERRRSSLLGSADGLQVKGEGVRAVRRSVAEPDGEPCGEPDDEPM